MKIFHLFANHKFTGPADPALILAAGQAAAGVDVRFLCSTVPEQKNTLEKIASNRGLQTIQGLRLSKHIRLSSLRSDVKKLRKLIEEEKPDFLHSHLDGDHLVATLARSAEGPALIRSRYDLSAPRGFRASWLARHTDLWIVPTEQAAEK
ncbi:MAG: glycosyltransferase, partial [Planctomycetota bacterium]